ncbi:MAG: DUF1592 domain-containing protein [Acidobacteria bacterium]|nr:DUF1592 domain-containing protein [Acidobacteriota bacterium]
MLRAGLITLVQLAFCAVAAAQTQTAEPLNLDGAKGLLSSYCGNCHMGDSAIAGFNLDQAQDEASLLLRPQQWSSAARRVRDMEMPPRGQPAPTPDEREALASWIEGTLRAGVCAVGLDPGPQPLRRLNRDEYAATIRDLLGVHFNAGAALPNDGAGGEGFDNAAETLFLSPMHAEKYLEAARQSLDYGLGDPRSRADFLIEPSDDLMAEAAAKATLERFLPRAFRRPVSEAEVRRYLDLFAAADRDDAPYDEAISFALQGVLMSPQFLFRVEQPNVNPQPQLVSDYELATRISYFLWGSMPDQELFDMAASGGLRDPDYLHNKVLCMLDDERSYEFAERFVEQWLGTRELGRDIQPDQNLFPVYDDAELQAAIRHEPILFFQDVLAGERSLLELIDSNFTFLNNKLQKHYGFHIKDLGQNPKRMEVPEDSGRGGILSMAAILAVSSYPHRTSPVLRGKWVLENLLGTPPPPPPPNVPELEENHGAVAARSLRERLEMHRRNVVCASCHDSIDPLGFGLENYDVLGRWRTSDKGMAIDARGALPNGVLFDGPKQLKAVLLERKDLFIRNLVSKMLGYALGRGLTLTDQCTIDRIVDELKDADYDAHTLILEIVNSVPFRYQPGTNPEARVILTEAP